MNDSLMLLEKRVEGPVEILCEEIDYPFTRDLEKSDLFLAFIKVLVSEIDKMRRLVGAIAPVTGNPPSEASGVVLEKVRAMLDCPSLVERDRLCHDLHIFIDEVNPDDAYPTDHLIDMLNSCVSAARFGLKIPCHSRHAASAADHVWEHRYGVTLQDSHTSRWKKDWARAKFQDALVMLWLSSLTPGDHK